jgi:hypothetical protein
MQQHAGAGPRTYLSLVLGMASQGCDAE